MRNVQTMDGAFGAYIRQGNDGKDVVTLERANEVVIVGKLDALKGFLREALNAKAGGHHVVTDNPVLVEALAASEVAAPEARSA